MINYVEHPSRGYAPRTKHNATSANLTLAFAADLGTAGERLTHQMAGMRYLGFQIDKELMNNPLFISETIGRISRECDYKNVKILNVAGNGIYTLNHYGITQDEINHFVYTILKGVVENSQVHRIISGGQTGVDIASGVAAYVLGVDCELTFPKGFLQRGLDKIDTQYTKAQIEASVLKMAQTLQQNLENTSTILTAETVEATTKESKPVATNSGVNSTRNTADNQTVNIENTENLETISKPVSRAPAYRFNWIKK